MSNKADWKSLYPFEPHYVPVSGGFQCHYVDEGPEGGRPLLMVHGNPTWSFYWRNLISPLSETYRTIAPDHIGCGLSEKPSEYKYPYQLHYRINDLCMLIEKLDLRDITLIAHDWGGAIGLGAATHLPDRFSRFVLLNTGAFTGERCPARIRVCRWPGFGRIALQGMNAFSLAALRMAVEHRECMTPEVKAGLIAPYDSWANRVAVYNFVKDIPMSVTHPSYSTLAGIEPGIREKLADLPTCLIWGMKDWCFTPSCLQRFEQMFNNSESHRLNDAGHYVVEDAKDRVLKITQNFLKSNS